MIIGKKGFTLIELLIVLIIIGVLATLAIPQYTSFVERARSAEALSMITAIKTAESTYKLESNTYTTSIGALSLLTGINESSIATAQYWWYQITSAGSTGYVLKANRSPKANGNTASYLQFTWNDSTGASWAGTPAAIVPKSE